jgi:predicted regulator of amino acid metabolism with ACT domain
MLKDKAVFHVPVSIDEYQKAVFEDFEVSHVHIQNSNAVKHTASNEEVVLSAILFVDSRRSTPVYDYMAMMAQAEAVGHEMTVTVIEASGNSAEYTVTIVDAVPDVPATRTHHTEIGLV